MTEKRDRAEYPEAVPVFPLENVVFFPHVVLPLHIFEPRYREMVARAGARDGLIAMALQRSEGQGDCPGGPDYHAVGCLGRMMDVTKTPDGRYHLKLVGVKKVAFGEVLEKEPYRTARIRPLEETIPGESDPRNHEDLARLLGACGVLVQELSERTFPMVSVKDGLPYEAVVNAICFHVGLPPEVKQHLLEVDDVRERCRRITQLIEDHLQKILLSREPEPGTGEEEPVN